MADRDCICEWDEQCGGLGFVQCLGCGGDQCVCAVHAGWPAELPCDGCDDCLGPENDDG